MRCRSDRLAYVRVNELHCAIISEIVRNEIAFEPSVIATRNDASKGDGGDRFWRVSWMPKRRSQRLGGSSLDRPAPSYREPELRSMMRPKLDKHSIAGVLVVRFDMSPPARGLQFASERLPHRPER